MLHGGIMYLMTCDRPTKFYGFGSYQKTRPYKQTGISFGVWVGAVVWRAGAVGSAKYATASLTCDGAGAVMKKLLAKCLKRKWGTGRQTDRPTDQPTD